MESKQPSEITPERQEQSSAMEKSMMVNISMVRNTGVASTNGSPKQKGFQTISIRDSSRIMSDMELAFLLTTFQKIKRRNTMVNHLICLTF